jgi:acyl-homoserine-lactone acylase
MSTSTSVGTAAYDASIRWTTHGVPHIAAADWGSLGFGQGWACARDHFATIADQVTKVRSERSLFLGPGEGDAHVNTDFGYLALDVRGRAEHMATTQPPEAAAMVEGYAAGVSAWLAEVGRDGLPEWCRDAAWIRPPSALDLYMTYVDLALIASGRNLAAYIGSAQPPGASTAVPATGPIESGLGSNGWAFGRDVTSTGRGMVMANPHFPWYGEARFWESHLTIPGELDVYGVNLIGAPGVTIGFNRHVAWTHTFSKGHRFTVYKLDLVPGDPTRYRYGDDERAATPTTHHIEVLRDGEQIGLDRTLWSSHYGPMVDLPFLGWSEAMGFTFRDTNLDNDQVIVQGLTNDRATSVAELKAGVAARSGLPWVNTMAADDAGHCLYMDSSSTPNLSAEADAAFVDNVDNDPITALLLSMRVALLDGSDPRFEWVDEPGAPAPGLVGFDNLPSLHRDDHVFNSNDPYWLAHATEQLPAHPALCGLHHRPVSPRTRMNALLVSAAGPTGASGPDGRFTPDDIEAAVLGNHSLMADLLLDAILDRLRTAVPEANPDDAASLTEAVAVLDAWDRRYELDSVGAVVWREFLGSFPDDALRDAGALFATGFDPLDPVATPHTLAPAPADGPDPVVRAMLDGISALRSASIALDAPLGSVQFVERSGRRIALHGANEVEGITNVVAPIGALASSSLEPTATAATPVPGRTERTGLHREGYPVTYGASFVMIAWFDDDGPHGRGLLAYGQSGDPASEHHWDQTEAFAAKELRPLLFHDASIEAATVERRRLQH